MVGAKGRPTPLWDRHVPVNSGESVTIVDYVLDERYTLIERIASGGMGEVWRGSDQILGRPVAIKMLAAAHAGDEQFRARYLAEARYASSLAHAGISRVLD